MPFLWLFSYFLYFHYPFFVCVWNERFSEINLWNTYFSCIKYYVQASKWRNNVIAMGKKVVIWFSQIVFSYSVYYYLTKAAIEIMSHRMAYNRNHSLILLEAKNPKLRYLSTGPCSLWKHKRLLSYLFQLPMALGCPWSVAI